MAKTLLRIAPMVWLVLSPASTLGAERDLAHEKEAAVAAARAWLALADAGQYAQTWDASAEILQTAVPKGQWVQQLGAARGPLGAVQKRELRSKGYRTSLPGAPDGEYVVIQFATSFANKKAAVETITPMRETDGTWRVSGYFIR